jgi:CheY-like chemotaxis protein
MADVRILVVDDDRSVSRVVASILADRGYAVDVAADGAEALKLVEMHQYTLAVLDYQMPGMDGVEVFRRARVKQPELLGIFLTAYTDLNTVFPAIDAGIERVLSKPPSRGELLPVVEELIGPTVV